MKTGSIKNWITRAFATILVLALVLSAAANLYHSYVNTMKQGDEMLIICAKNVSNLLNHQWSLDRLGQSADSEVYQEAHEVLRKLCGIYHLDYLYIYTIDPEAPSRYYYMYVSSDPEKDADVQGEFALHKKNADGILTEEQALLDGSEDLQRIFSKDQFDSDFTWLAPYYNSDKELCALIGMDYKLSQVMQRILTEFMQNIIPFVLSLSIGFYFLLLLVQRRIITPIGALSKSMKLFAQDSRKEPEPLHVKAIDEIGEIVSSYEKMTEDISAYVNNIEVLTRERLETNVQLEVARRIQYGLVPEKTTIEEEGFSVSAMTHPAKAVGGDFYDCFRRDESCICLVMGDVSGKGITAAICMAMLKTAIREKLIAGLSPAETLNQANTEFLAQNPENLFCTVFVAILNPFTGELRYANAGHTYPILLKEKPSLLIPDKGIALGMFEDANIKDYSMMLSAGEGILLYTDGVTEAVNPQKQFFGTDRLLEALNGATEAESTEEPILRVSCAVNDFCDGAEFFDDMALMALIYRGAAPQSLPVELSAFDEIKKTVFAVAGDTPETRRALLACDETLTNIVSYSGAKTLTFTCEKQDELLRVTFSDDGIAFDPTTTITEEKGFDFLDSGGMGLNMIRQSAASMQYERKNGRNNFTVFFPL